jgi:hypothetical protein
VLTAFPALGHDVSSIYRTHPRDLSAQKVSSPFLEAVTAHLRWGYNLPAVQLTVNEISMDLGIFGAVMMIVVWGIIVATSEAPGYTHLLLTLGVFLLIWRITVRSKRTPKLPPG